MLAMELDHDSGAMDGKVLVGEFRSRRLSELDRESLLRLLEACQGAADQSAALLEAYLDRTFQDWRSAASHRNRASHFPPGAMTREEAYAVLGLKPGASVEEVRAAHRHLMKQLHPDRGGSDYLAAKINQAKDVLVG
jgi:DnaJ-domain-containing protein 1